jgi:ribosomal protein S18 acetylase RimI-like enzyme
MMANSEPWITLCRDFDGSLGMLTDRSSEAHLAIADGEIARFTILDMHGAFGCIQSVCVAPQWRNKGIGTHLTDFAEKEYSAKRPMFSLVFHHFIDGS